MHVDKLSLTPRTPALEPPLTSRIHPRRISSTRQHGNLLLLGLSRARLDFGLLLLGSWASRSSSSRRHGFQLLSLNVTWVVGDIFFRVGYGGFVHFGHGRPRLTGGICVVDLV